LSAIRHLDTQQAAQTQNVMQSERAFEGARLRYRAGSGDYLSVLDSQRTLYAAREQSSQYKLARLQAVVGLCKALGGGWQQPVSSTRSP
jgi:outer membrane protein TolC